LIVDYIDVHRDRFGVEPICRVLSQHDLPIAPSTYHAHKAQPVSDADWDDAHMANVALDVWRANRSLYGADKLATAMRKAGYDVGRDQVARLMGIVGIRGVRRGKHRTITTVRDAKAARHPDLIRRAWSTPTRPDLWWVADFTYVWTLEGFVYTSFVTDVCSRRILGWRVSASKATPLVMSALEQALFTRRRTDARFTSKGLVFHSDAGSQGELNWSSQHLDRGGVRMAMMRERQREVQLYRGQVPSPGRPTVAWREDRVRFWAAIARGVMTEDAAAEAGVSSPVGFRWFRHAGGVNPCLPPTVSGRYLSFSEREDIALLRAKGLGVREIARRVKRDPSTVSRELRRNASTRTWRLDYKPSIAQWHAERRARRPKVAKLVTNDRLREYVHERLAGVVRAPDGRVVGPDGPAWKGRNKPHRKHRRWVQAWSPEQISNRLRLDFPNDESMRISHEAIYQALYVQSRGALRRELVACLRTGRALRVPRARAKRKAWAHVTPEVMISERPAEVADRAVPGHWEGDLLIGLERSAIGTLVERTTRFMLLVHLPRGEGFGVIPRTHNGPALAGYGAVTMKNALAAMMGTLPEQLRRSLTWDRGKELSAHAAFKVETGIPVFFADPHSPWQRGTNENTNGLLRQYFPKGTDLSRWNAEDIEAVAVALNARPRKILGWKTPAEVFDEHLRSLQPAGVASID
jgi:transposase, IS30 family